jgi:hypothetical protein
MLTECSNCNKETNTIDIIHGKPFCTICMNASKENNQCLLCNKKIPQKEGFTGEMEKIGKGTSPILDPKGRFYICSECSS